MGNKKKKLLAIFASAAIAISSLAACGNSSGSSSSSAGSSTSKYKIAMIIDGTVTDGGWGASCYKAMLDSAKKYNWSTAYSENVAQADYVSAMSNYADQGYNLIFAPGAQYQDAVSQVAKEYSDVDFVVLNGSQKSANMVSVLPDATEIGYMAGALAALVTKTNNIGFIGGTELDTTKAKLAGFTKAAQKVNAQVQVHSAYAGSFTDAAKGKDIASTMINTYDADVFFGDASVVDTGAREALTAGKQFSIGQPSDLGSATDKVIVSSVVTDNAALLNQCMEDVEKNTFGNKIIEGNLKNGCLSVGTFSNTVSSDIQSKYQDIVTEIKNGTFLG